MTDDPLDTTPLADLIADAKPGEITIIPGKRDTIFLGGEARELLARWVRWYERRFDLAPNLCTACGDSRREDDHTDDCFYRLTKEVLDASCPSR